MTFEWDPSKAAGNGRKRRIAFGDAVAVFEDPRALTLDDPHPNEARHIAIGLDFLGRVLGLASGRASPAVEALIR